MKIVQVYRSGGNRPVYEVTYKKDDFGNRLMKKFYSDRSLLVFLGKVAGFSAIGQGITFMK